MNKRILILFGAVIAISVVLIVVFQKKSTDTVQTGKITTDIKPVVITTFYPLYHFAEQVGGDLIEVTSIAPSGVEPHDYEPTPQDIIKIKNADVFVYNGAGFETWVERVLPQTEGDKVQVVEMASKVQLLSSEEETEDHANEADAHDEEHGEFDPHIWLDPTRAQQEVLAIRDVLVEVDPQNANTYRQNAEEYINALAQLDQSYRTGFAQCAKREIVTSHNAFRYLANQYQFDVHAISGLSTIEDPSPQHLAQLTQTIKNENIKYIFTESLVSPKFSETLSKETGAQTLVLNPIEGLTPEQERQGMNYESLMRENLKNLRIGMECK